MKIIKNNVGEQRNGSQKDKKLDILFNSHSDLDKYSEFVCQTVRLCLFENHFWLNKNINNREI